jgi:hypothetical protein
MKSLTRILIISFLLLAAPALRTLHSQPLTDAVTDERIKTVQLVKDGWALSYPIIRSSGDEKLVLDFDLLGSDPESFYYTFIHCDRDWNESGIFQSDYLEGLNEDQIEDYKSSFNTKISYYHYKLIFPGERMQLRLPGNYIIKVYTSGNADRPVLTKRFMISEESVNVSVSVHRPLSADVYNTGQQVDFTVNYTGLRVNDPSKDISSVVLQNGKWYDARYNIRPDMVGNNELRYSSLSSNNIFPGGNEYRYFDTKSIHYQTEFIRKIDFTDNRYHVFLTPSDNREFKPYFFDRDLNGKYYVAIKEGKNMDTDPDYLWVYFTLPSMNKREDGDVYVSGALSNWEFNDSNRMIFDSDKREYQCSMPLKQGWYNYEYVFVRKGEKPSGPSLFEGNHFETENDYLIIVYYRKPGERFDRIVAATVTKSTGRDTN